MLTRSGHELPVEVSVRQVMTNNISRLQWIVRDISERRNLDTLRNDLTSMVYHDLRSPLGNVISSLDVLETMQAVQEDPSDEIPGGDCHALHAAHPAPDRFAAGYEPPGSGAAHRQPPAHRDDRR